MFTLNNPLPVFDTDKVLGLFKKHKHFRYVVFQLESGEDNTLHYQGYVEFNSAMTLVGVKKIIHQAHWELRRGSPKQAIDYCTKEDTKVDGPWTCGESKSQGHRTDLDEMAKACIGCVNPSEIIEMHPATYARYSKGFERIMFLTAPKRRQPPVVSLYYGPTGTGKTRSAFSDNPELYRKPPDSIWFDGYFGQDCLLLDDFSGASSKMSLSYLLQLIDRYPIQLQVKGSYASLLATTIIITTNIHPSKWYNYQNRETQYHALQRRIHNVMYFKAFEETPVLLEQDSFFDKWFQGCDEESIFEEVDVDEELIIPDIDNIEDTDEYSQEDLFPDVDELHAQTSHQPRSCIDLTADESESELFDRNYGGTLKR